MLEDKFKFHVVGAGRGGTSLLAGLLDYHSQLVVGFEEYSISYLMGKGLESKGSEVFKSRVAAYIEACNRLSKGNPGVYWGNKITTEQIHGLEDHNDVNPASKIDVLDEFFNSALQEKKVVFILRDGRACVKSKVLRSGHSIAEACKRWRYSIKCYKFFKNRHANNICIRFEDLLVNPEKALKNICIFLDVPYQEEMLGGIKNEKMLPEYRKDLLDVSKASSDVCFSEPFLQSIHEDMVYCGYL
ncbi:MAG: hypothetical protein C1943_11430 [Halochromatium sp.]|nr:hypothetical protein [Halochromatium sp.]